MRGGSSKSNKPIDVPLAVIDEEHHGDDKSSVGRWGRREEREKVGSEDVVTYLCRELVVMWAHNLTRGRSLG